MAVALLMKTRRQQPELVKPAKPTPNESKELSDIDDQGGLRYQSPAIMAYKHTPSVEGKDPAKMIKSALSEALVYYYPLAGRLREGHNQKLIVDCTGDGALFVEAESDVTLEQIGDAILPPCPLMDELLLDAFGSQGVIASPLLVFQVTRLKCGGFILGVRYNHTICDVFGFAQLMNSVVEIVRGVEKPSTSPVWERHLLTARNPPCITCVHHEYDCKEETEKRKGRPVGAMDDTEKKILKAFFFGPEEMRTIRKHLPPHLHKTCSSYELLCAFIWRCRTSSLQLDADDIVRFSSAVSIRGNDRCVPLPFGYYGNSFAVPAVISKAKVLCESPLEYALKLVKEAREKLNEEYVRSVTDLMVIKGRPKFVGSSANWLVANTMRTGLEKVDFGWGVPVFAGVMSTPINPTSTFSRFRDVIAVPLWLPSSAMSRFQKEVQRLVGDGCLNDATAGMRSML